ncbi:MAG: TRAP transporter small permease [Deltaproteobacteria bacterium]|jgi:TRAP-type C4-dicarboxylate transport system permease small subunit|nr:TRAP transporter small permease [Deltaproteobacteria bacterium]
MMDRLERLDDTINRVEQILLVTSLSLMILIAFLQIILRNLFVTGLSWGDTLLRNLVLWIGFIGAAIATKEGKHINIDVASRWLPFAGKNLAGRCTHLFSFLICGLLAYAALKFIKHEAQMGNVTLLNIPTWIPATILPVTFGLMTFRFGLHFLKTLSGVGKFGIMDEREKER